VVWAVGMAALLVAQTVVCAVGMAALLVGMLQLQGMLQGTVRVWQGRVTVAGSMAGTVVCCWAMTATKPPAEFSQM
jgi:hypothetical protein